MSDFIIERYLVARRIWKRRSEMAHDGFPASDRRAAVPAQTWGEWFEWAYGMTLDAYAALAKDGDHEKLVEKLGAVLVEYRIGERWLTMIAAPGETYEGAAKALLARFPQVEETRPRA